MPADLVYHTYVDADGKPRIEPGPLLRHGEQLVTFFFNEINRARPQVQSLLLRAMAERTVSAFNREYRFPHMLVFADRNRVEKEETFELPSAARDRFMFELRMPTPAEVEVRRSLVFNPDFHDVDELLQRGLTRRAAVAGAQPDRRRDSTEHQGKRGARALRAGPLGRESIAAALRCAHRWRGHGQADSRRRQPARMMTLARAARVVAWLAGRHLSRAGRRAEHRALGPGASRVLHAGL
jgi:MoxR-like ATPase